MYFGYIKLWNYLHKVCIGSQSDSCTYDQGLGDIQFCCKLHVVCYAIHHHRIGCVCTIWRSPCPCRVGFPNQECFNPGTFVQKYIMIETLLIINLPFWGNNHKVDERDLLRSLRYKLRSDVNSLNYLVVLEEHHWNFIRESNLGISVIQSEWRRRRDHCTFNAISTGRIINPYYWILIIIIIGESSIIYRLGVNIESHWYHGRNHHKGHIFPAITNFCYADQINPNYIWFITIYLNTLLE